MTKKLLTSLLLTFLLSFGLFAQTAVQRHGKLRTEGAYLLNEHGKIVQLRGMSFFWSTPEWPGYKYYNAATVDALINDWKCTVVRVAYDRNNGNDKGWDGVKAVIDAAIAKGIYVVIDWHSHTAEQQSSAAISFFSQQAALYKNTPNVIFEVYNEPITGGGATTGSLVDAQKTWGAIKPYLTNVTKAIRDAGADNIIIIGTPYYCQHIGVAAGDPIKDASGKPYNNLVYSFHFYAASHGPEAYYYKNGDGSGGLENTYLEGGLGRVPVFVSEWGTTHSDGGQDGHNYIDGTNTDWWFNRYINGEYKLSWCNWSVSDFQPSSAFSGSPSSPSASGQIVKRHLTASTVDAYDPPWEAGNVGPAKDTVFNMPATHPTNRYNRSYGASVKAADVSYSSRDKVDVRTANNKCLTVSNGADGNWVSYEINSTSSTQHLVMRYLATAGSGSVDVYLDGTKTGSLSLPQNTTWTTVSTNMAVSAGKHSVKLVFANTNGTYSIEWLELTNTLTAAITRQTVSRNLTFSTVRNGFSVSLPQNHGFTSYEVVGADGRVVKSGSVNAADLNVNNVANGIWFVKLNGEKSRTFKAVLTGK